MLSTITNPPGGGGCDIQPLSSSQQPPAGGSSDMESGDRCLYRQHYTAHTDSTGCHLQVLSHRAFKRWRRDWCQLYLANYTSTFYIILIMILKVSLSVLWLILTISKILFCCIYCRYGVEGGGWPRCDLNPTITFILMFLTDISLPGLSTLRTRTWLGNMIRRNVYHRW